MDWLTVVFDVVQDIAQDLVGPLVGVDFSDQLGAVIIEHRFGFLIVDLEAALDDIGIDVVQSVFLQGASLQAVEDLGFVGAEEMEDAVDIEAGAEDFRLVDVAGNAVEHEEVDVGLEASGFFHRLDLLRPEFDGDVVGNELAFAGIFQKSLAQGRADIDGAKDVAAGAVKEAGNGADDFALSAFTGTWSPKE